MNQLESMAIEKECIEERQNTEVLKQNFKEIIPINNYSEFNSVQDITKSYLDRKEKIYIQKFKIKQKIERLTVKLVLMH